LIFSYPVVFSYKFDINKVLKLMILLSKTNDGLSNSDYTQLTNQFLRVNELFKSIKNRFQSVKIIFISIKTYGYDKAFILQKLKKLTLFESVDKSDDLSSKANLLKRTLIQLNCNIESQYNFINIFLFIL
jgi:hypothetical protein